MPEPISNDLRKRIVHSVQGGLSCRATARQYCVAPSTVIKIMARVKSEGTYAPQTMGRPPGDGKLAPYEGFLLALLAKTPDMTLADLQGALFEQHGVSASLPGLFYLLKKKGYSFKKNSARHRT